MSAKDTINVKFIDKIKCFCKEDIGEHSLKNLKRHYYKALTALAGSEKYIKEMYAELNRINFDLAVYKKKFGENALNVAEKNGYHVPTYEEYKLFQLTPLEYRGE